MLTGTLYALCIYIYVYQIEYATERLFMLIYIHRQFHKLCIDRSINIIDYLSSLPASSPKNYSIQFYVAQITETAV